LLNLSITVDGEAQLVRRLTRVSENLIDFTGPTGKAAQKAFQGEEFDQFFTEGRKAWPQLSPKYQAWKDEHFPFMPIMQRTQRLYRSLIGSTDDTIFQAEKLSLTLGTKVPYAVYHQRGGKRLPKRKVIDMSEKGKRDIVRAIQRATIGRARQEWGTSAGRLGYVQTELEDFE
jgi:phage gpG-like protein